MTDQEREKTMDEKNNNSTSVSKESNQPFHIKYRPKNFDEFLGNEETIESLKSFLARENRPHTYLFTGPSGTGKTTLGRIIAKELGCHHIELYEMNTADTRGIDPIRQVIEFSRYVPTMGKCKVFLFDEAHGLTSDAQEALLKLAEEPLRYVYLIFCTTKPEELRDTLKNRCQTFSLNPLDEKTMKVLILRVLDQEKAELSPGDLESLIKSSDGIPRAAQMLLHKIITLDKGERERILLSEAKRATLKERIIELCRIFLSEPVRAEQNAKWEEIQEILKDPYSPPEIIRGLIRENMAEALLNVTREDLRGRVNEIIGYFSSGGKDFDKLRLVEVCHRVIFGIREKGKQSQVKGRTKTSASTTTT
ncbi:MAG: AAA family ATPase [Syntrophaceae bacterium]|nr:AAA family ATPase [Syntrophaceae bacterium]